MNVLGHNWCSSWAVRMLYHWAGNVKQFRLYWDGDTAPSAWKLHEVLNGIPLIVLFIDLLILVLFPPITWLGNAACVAECLLFPHKQMRPVTCPTVVVTLCFLPLCLSVLSLSNSWTRGEIINEIRYEGHAICGYCRIQSLAMYNVDLLV
jgi:hypothetical protein